MENLFKKCFLENIPRKLFALLCALVIWITINNSITSTRVFTRVPIRIVNLPADKTICGLMPNSILDRKITLTLTGTKRVIEKLDSTDFEVVIDAANKGDEWIVQVSKKNLVSLNPEIDLLHSITDVSHSELIIHLSRLVTAKVPVWVLPPKGEAPEGYQFLDVWPQKLYHVISGPEEYIKQLQEEGLPLKMNLSSITKEDLDLLRSDEFGDADEVSFFVPDNWKKVEIPFLNNALQSINGQEAKHLRLDFLREELTPLKEKIPVHLFFPTSLLQEYNPQTIRLISSPCIIMEKGVAFINKRLYVSDVSRGFLDVVRDHLEILLIPVKQNNQLSFQWHVQFIDPVQLEEKYVASVLSGSEPTVEPESQTTMQLWKQHLLQRTQYSKMRFREYMERFKLYVEKNEKLNFAITVDKEGNISLKDID